MLSVSGEVKVMDFGIARLSSEETSGMFVKGKIRYMPPEQFERGVRAPTLDLFAVGAILHELLDGRRFRSGDYEQAELLGMCLRGAVPPLTCPPARVPPVFEQLRKALLEPVAANRLQSARAAHRLLSGWPGDRDAKFELEEVVRRFVEDSSLTTAAVVLATTKAVVSNIAEIEEEPVSNDEMTDIRRIGELSDTHADIRKSAFARRPARHTRTKRLAGLLAGVAGLVAVGLGTTLGAWVESEPDELGSEDSAEPIVIKAKPVPVAELPPVVEPKPQVAPEPPPVPEAKQERITQTSVRITAGGVWAQVKIGRKQYTLDRLGGAKQITAKLEPGAYMVSFRNDAEAAWKPLGKVRIPARGPITLDVRNEKFTLGK
jgi:hypothetical protein